jgi:hypothetical protein
MLPSIIQARPDRAPQLVQLMVEASSLRGKDKLREILQDPAPDPAQQQMAAMMQQMQAMMAQLEMRAKQADIAKTESETAENVAQAQAIAERSQMEALRTGAGLVV